MSYLDKLTKNMRSSLTHYVDQYVRDECNYAYNDYSDEQVNKVIERLRKKYLQLGSTESKFKEINEAFLGSQEFLEDLKNYIVSFLENRPSKERVSYYHSLSC